jgi:hypothetical protein
MGVRRTVQMLAFGLGVSLVLLMQGNGQAARDNDYRAGYVIGYAEQPEVSAKDPSMTYGRYAAEKRKMLEESGPVPNDFHRGLRDGFRDAIRKKTARYTIEDVDPSALPPYLLPKAK